MLPKFGKNSHLRHTECYEKIHATLQTKSDNPHVDENSPLGVTLIVFHDVTDGLGLKVSKVSHDDR